MIIQVDQELCAGCGACVEVCSEGAIHVLENRVMIDDSLCTQCEACIEACVNDAISASPDPEHSTVAMNLPVLIPGSIPSQIQPVPVKSTAPSRGLTPLAGAALAFLGSEVAPRLVDVLITTLERKLTRPTAPVPSISATKSMSPVVQNRGKRKQIRYRGGCTSPRMQKGRR